MDQTIGPYQIESELGRGGMGVVYRARDERLGRTVAIKALPEELAQDPGRLERFEREARTLAQLNHPNLAGIHGLEEHAGADGQTNRYLVLEYVEGETLADRLDRGVLPADEAAELAAQIAAGIAAAHEAGVVHRDLKPGNIMLTPDGRAKVLDFGLAKSDEGMSSTGSGHSQSPTLTNPNPRHSPTIPGAILGTAAYMSPEQARGRRVDQRTDVWSFGVILYEMLVGASPFVGETASDSIGAVLHKEFNLERLPRETPASVRRVLRRCLQRDKELRYHSLADARLELLSGSVDSAAGDISDSSGSALGPVGVVGWLVAVVALAVAAWLFVSGPEVYNTTYLGGGRLEADLVTDRSIELARLVAPPRISPDSRRVAYLVYNEGENETRLAVRDLSTGEERVLRGPVDPRSPEWTADGRSIVYASGFQLQRIDVNGGRPETLGDIGEAGRYSVAGINPEGLYTYSRMRGPLRAFDPDTGESTVIADPIPERSGDWVVAPSFLPDGEHVLYSNQDDVTVDSGLYVSSLTEGWSRRLLPFETSAVFVEPDLVVYWNEGSLLVRRFDLEALDFVGDPVVVAEGVLRQNWPSFGIFDATPDLLVYVADESAGAADGMFLRDLATGEETPLGIEGSLWSPYVSPDGRYLSFDRTFPATAGDIYVYEFETGIERVISRDEGNESIPIWGPESDEVFFFRGPDIYRARVDRVRAPEAVLESSEAKFPAAVTPDGRSLLLSRSNNSGNQSHIQLLDLETGELTDWGQDPNANMYATGLAGDGEWVLFESDVSGAWTHYADRLDRTSENPIRLIPGFGRGTRIMGDQVLYLTSDAVMAIRLRISPDGELVPERPQRLMDPDGVRFIAPMPGWERAVVIRSLAPTRGGSIRFVRNWIPDEFRFPPQD